MKHSSFQLTQSHASNFCYAKRTQKKIQLHFSSHSLQSFFSLTLHVISFNQTFFFLPKRKKPDETYRKSYDVYSNRDATRSEIFVSVLSRDTTETTESGPRPLAQLSKFENIQKPNLFQFFSKINESKKKNNQKVGENT